MESGVAELIDTIPSPPVDRITGEIPPGGSFP
jgi:hypothetical protein